MAERLPPAMLARLRELLAERMGIHFSAERVSDLERAMESAAREAGYSSTEACLQELLSSPWKRTQIELLARHLSVGETYFFRDKKIFETLERHVLPELIRSRDQKRLRIWSAGCATGEEPYSVAILLRRSLPDLADWHVTILATDINPSFLEKARRGVYSEWSFRDAPRWLKEHYFRRRREGLYEIGPEVREMVVFSYLNLAEDQYPSLLTNTNAMDLVLCRNVLMYFAAEKARSVLDRLHRALVDGGWLITSPSEVSDTLVRRFRRVSFDDATLYKKDAGPAETRLETPEVAGLVRSGIAPEAAAGAPPSFTVGTESEISFSALASGSAFEARPAVRSDRGAADSP
ncbi:MAG TPA: protein-glutamate O-methyltransferase CheR, partial [candidate division Zixibacteria bacterium]|nr:protein-glutamate O-methyltransferase CheR [candidate division Zixibacteria bacterium]